METTKRVYTKPVILRVLLNREQAVLSVCSTSATGLENSNPRFCNAPEFGPIDFHPMGCRKSSSNSGTNSVATS